MMNDWHWGFGFGHGLFGIVFWIIVIALVVLVLRALVGGGAGDRQEMSALEVLRKRYARGEIDRDEFERRRRDLEE